MADRATLTLGDAATLPLAVHDWVVLDRVICCYPGAAAPLSNSIPAARRRYAFSVPDSRGWRGVAARVVRAIDNGWNRVPGRRCTTYVHDLDRMEETLRRAGLERRSVARRGLWYLALFERL